jgi:hypothetical protein
MAITVDSYTAIDNSKNLDNVISTRCCQYNAFHPDGIYDIGTATAIPWDYAVISRTLTADTTFTDSIPASNSPEMDRTVLLHLDCSGNNYTPTFPAEFNFALEPTWSSHRFWAITIKANVFDKVLCTAIGFDEGPYSGGQVGGGGSTASVDPTFTTTGFRTYDIEYGASGFVETWTDIQFSHDPSNSRILVRKRNGSSQQIANITDHYINYTGLSNITSIEAQYNVSTQQCSGDCSASSYGFGPLPTDDSKNNATYYSVPVTFGWMANSNPNSWANNQATTTANFDTANPDFRVKIVDSVEGTFYSTGTVGGFGTQLYLRAYKGSVAEK